MDNIFENPPSSSDIFGSLNVESLDAESLDVESIAHTNGMGGTDTDFENILDIMTSPSVLNSNLDKEVGNTLYMDNLQLIKKVEIMLGNKEIDEATVKKDTIKYVNSKLAMRTLNISMEYKRISGENRLTNICLIINHLMVLYKKCFLKKKI